MRKKAMSAALVGTGLLVAFLAVPASSSAQVTSAPSAGTHRGGSGPVVVASGLNNPRQLAVMDNGDLLVAEGGRGGDQCVNLGGPDVTCFGMTGSISVLRNPGLRRDSAPIRVITGLLSAGARNGAGSSGPDGVSAGSLRDIHFAMLGTPPELVPAGLDNSMVGKLMRSRGLGTPAPVADLRAFEIANDPDGQGVDANPHAVLAMRDRVLVADAAGNDILQVRDGRLSLFAVLPNLTDGPCAGLPNDAGTTGCDAVPTSLAAGPDGSVYVGLLAGLTPGAGRVLRLDGRTGQVTRQWTGLTAVTGVAVGRDGSVFASQMFTSAGPAGPDPASGRVTRIRADGTRTDINVPLPAGLAIAGYNLYVAAWNTAPSTGLGIPDIDSSGQIWRIRI